MKRIHVLFTGKVQGVFFRKTTRDYASELGVTGWVKNLSDGRVEMLAEGSDAKLGQLLNALEESFQIISKEIRELAADGGFPDFRIKK